MLTTHDMKKIDKVFGEKIFDVVKAAVNAMEERIVKRVSRQTTLPFFNTPPEYESTPPHISTTNAIKIRVTTFGQLLSGSVFRLEAGSQPIIKLESNSSWTVSMGQDANAFYLRTGSTVRFADNKRIVPLKSTITIDQ